MPNPKLPVSENWRWPPREAMPGEVCIGHINGLRCSHPVGHDGPCAFRDPAASQLRRDRDELAAALEKLRAEFEHRFQDGNDLDWRECGALADGTGALLARVKGR